MNCLQCSGKNQNTWNNVSRFWQYSASIHWFVPWEEHWKGSYSSISMIFKYEYWYDNLSWLFILRKSSFTVNLIDSLSVRPGMVLLSKELVVLQSMLLQNIGIKNARVSSGLVGKPGLSVSIYYYAIFSFLLHTYARIYYTLY